MTLLALSRSGTSPNMLWAIHGISSRKTPAQRGIGARGMLIGGLVLGLIGCAELQRDVRTIYGDKENFVGLAQDPTVKGTDPATHHAHPIQLPSDALPALLRAIYIEERGGSLRSAILGKPLRAKAFRDQEVALLAPPLRDGLAKASPAEQVVFALSQTRPGQVQEVTSGSMFVDGRNLHVVLTNYRYPIDLSEGRPAYDAHSHPELPITPQEHSLFFEREEFAARPTVGTFTRWFGTERAELIIDYARFLMAEAKQPSPRSAQPAEPVPAERTSPASPVIAPGEAVAAPPTLPASSASPPMEVLSHQLKLLQQLFEQKLQEVEALKAQLAGAKRKLAAREAEIKQLKAKRKPSTVPKKPTP